MSILHWEAMGNPTQNVRVFNAFCNCVEESSLIAAFAELWEQSFFMQLRHYRSDTWDTVSAGIQVWHGGVSLTPFLSTKQLSNLPGCNLFLNTCQHNIESLEVTLDEETGNYPELDVAVDKAEKDWCQWLMNAYASVRSKDSIRQIVTQRPVRFQVITEPDEPPILETVLD